MVEDQEDPLVILEEGSKEEHVVEDQLDKPHEADCKDSAEEDKAGKNSNYNDLMNVEDNMTNVQLFDIGSSERKNSPTKLVHSKVLSITILQSRSRRIRVQTFRLWGRKPKKEVKSTTTSWKGK